MQPSPSPSPSPQYRSTRPTKARKPVVGPALGATILPRAAAVVSLTGLSLSLSAALAEARVAPLASSNYSVRAACGQPSAGHAGCLALQLVPDTRAARSRTRPLGMSAPRAIEAASAAEGAYGLRPADLHSAYSLPEAAPTQQTVGIVDAYDDPNIEADLATYDREFGLPECTSAAGCFEKINQAGQSAPLPPADGEWALEISLDVEIAHATCQNCRILLVEASSNSDAALEAAENRAVAAGATEISNSWGSREPVSDSAAFNHPGVVITAAAGDNGYLGWDGWEPSERGFVNYPASSPHVVAVGGTSLQLGEHGAWKSESAWNDGDGAAGGGCSPDYPAPSWQTSLANWAAVGCGDMRAVSDVAAVADPYTGVAIYDSTPWYGYVFGWVTVGGTSLSSPLVAASFALAGGNHSPTGYPAQTLYESALENPGALHDVTVGSNGECNRAPTAEGLSGCTPQESAASCSGQSVCLAGPGYDGPSGVGSPNGLGAFMAGAAAAELGGSGRSNGAGAGGGSGVGANSAADAVPPPARPAATAAKSVRLFGLRLAGRSGRSTRRGGRRGTPALVFTSSGAAPVRLTLSLLASAARGAARTARIGRRVASFQIAARKGHNAWPLRHLHDLRPGRYRLTLAPAAGLTRSIELEVL